MKLTGDPAGLDELKKMKESRMEYLKYLITEAKTNFDHCAQFKGQDGTSKYKLVYDPQSGGFDVQKL